MKRLQTAESASPRPLVDPFARTITYLRVSVTDRCDLRCAYCMPERMTFLPRTDLLTIEELERLILVFIRRGVRKVRITGGEPLTRKGVMTLIARLGEQARNGAIDETTLTTNGVQLARHASALARAGVKRVNISLDTLRPDVFARLTGRPVLSSVLEGIEAAQDAGIAIKINSVALKNYNVREIPDIIAWTHDRGMDMSLIEVMPMGRVEEERTDQYWPLSTVRADLEKRWTLTDLAYRTGGPSRYVRVEQTGGRLGFITPLTQNFCEGCNRVRLTCTGRLYQCLGRSTHLDFRSLLRDGATDDALDAALDAAIARKPEGHDFAIRPQDATPAVVRQMSVTGG